jgi:hypothetical protein
MQLIDKIANPAGLCVLTAQGELAFYEADGTWQVDALLTERWRAYLKEFLDRYLKNPEAEGLRVALLGAASGHQAWGDVSLYLDEATVRILYPVAGRNNQVLTAFQRKNIEKGLYRGMELLLEYRHTETPKSVVYCPVLFDRNAGGSPQATGAIEVLNLAAGLTSTQRAEPPLVALWERVYRGLIRKDRRHDDRFSLLDDAENQWDSGSDASAYEEIDKRWDRGVNLTAEDLAHLHAQYRYDQVERWLEIPYRPVEPERLRQFVHFRNMDDARLRLLSRLALIYTAPPGACLLERGMTDKWNLYLLEGSMTLEPEEGATLMVEGGSERGTAPIAFLKPRKYTVTAASKVSFLWIHDTLLHVAQTSGQLPAALTEAAAKAEAEALLARLSEPSGGSG